MAEKTIAIGSSILSRNERLAAELRERFAAVLAERRGEDLRRQQTCAGPHRDDVTFLIDGRDARAFGSQGQQRSVALALKMAEVELADEILGSRPLLLLDDVMSELDEARREAVMSYVREGIQTIDGDILYNAQNGKYYLYFKHDEDQTIAYVTADRPEGPYTDAPVVVSLAPTGVEGSSMYPITGTDTWVMLMDEYGEGRYFAQQTTDFETFEKLRRSDYQMDFGPRHGSVVAITDAEYDALVAAFGK